MREALVAFYQSTQFKPVRIVVYRDAAMSTVATYRQEVELIRRACISLEENYLPAVTYISVNKRHHTRLFCANRRDAVSGRLLCVH